jgi:hypothetical protein
MRKLDKEYNHGKQHEPFRSCAPPQQQYRLTFLSIPNCGELVKLAKDLWGLNMRFKGMAGGRLK